MTRPNSLAHRTTWLRSDFNPNPGKLQELLNNKNNVVVYDKQKDGSQRTSGSMVPSVLNDSPFYDSIIPQTDPDVNSEFSFATDEQLRKQAIKMLQEGISAKQVYEKTGFFIDDKGRLRNDTDDTDSSDPAIRKPYPVENLKRVKSEAEAKLEAERDMATTFPPTQVSLLYQPFRLYYTAS